MVDTPSVTFPNAVITFQAHSVSIVIPDALANAIAQLDSKVNSLVSQGSLIMENQTHNIGVIMTAFDDLEKKMADLEDAETVVEATLDAVHQELVDMLTSGATPVRVQALADRIDQLKAKAMAAAARDPDPAATPPAGTPPDQPPP